MTLDAARLLAWLALAYLTVGVAFAVLFAARWAKRLDTAAGSGTIGFRILIIPGAMLLWPLLSFLLLRGRTR